MSTEIKLEKFQGPLDLLLQLIEQEKMSITDVSLSKVTEQFLDHLDKMETDRSENLADFLVIATKLVYIKSKNILPYLYPPEEDDGPGLADQLKLYKQYIEASKKINIFWQANKISYGRIEPPVKVEGFILPHNAQATDLHASMTKLVKRLQPLRPLARMNMDKSISIKQKIENIRNLLINLKKFNFNEVVKDAGNKTDVIISFLALLELVKDKTVYIKQQGAFGEMTVEKI